MWKRFPCFAVTLLMIAALICPAITASADDTLRKGDTVQFIFTIGEAENIAGIAAKSKYNADYLELDGEPEFLVDGQGMTNLREAGKINWSIMMNDGRAFENDDIFVETFTVIRKCALDDAQLLFECDEIFAHDFTNLPLTLMTARIEVLPTGTDDDESDSEEIESDADSEDIGASDTETDENSENNGNNENNGKNGKNEDTETDVPTESSDEEKTESEETEISRPSSIPERQNVSISPVIITSTDLTPEEDDTVSLDDSTSRVIRSTRPTSSRTATSAPSSSSSKTTSSKASSAASSKAQSASSSSAVSSKAESKAESTTTSRETSSVKTETHSSPQKASSAASSAVTAHGAFAAQRVLIAAIAAIIVASLAVALLTKQIKTEEES